MNDQRLVLILDNIRSAHNVGSIFRTAACFGTEALVLCGVTPAPRDRFGRENNKVTKVSLGAEKLITWKQETSIETVIEVLKQEDWTISALEQCENSVDISRALTVKKRALILGEETKGISQEILEMCDEVIEIPHLKGKESLNVSVATGIALFTLT